MIPGIDWPLLPYVTPMSADELAAAVGLGSRAVPDLPDALIALGFLACEGTGADRRLTAVGKVDKKRLATLVPVERAGVV